MADLVIGSLHKTTHTDSRKLDEQIYQKHAVLDKNKKVNLRRYLDTQEGH